tara:strand:+ start:5625 stop:6710 length:1086 start_codon:yes stop_codon:yes gene_type:complete
MATTITEQIVREAPEIEALKLGLVASAKDLSDISIQLPERQIAGLTSLQQQAATLGQAPGGIGGYQQFLTTGSDTLGTGLGTLGSGLGTLGTALGTLGQSQAPISAAQQSIAGSGQLFSPSDLSAYTNPYQQQVIDTTIAEMNRQGEISRNNLAAQGVGAGAFGGSRFGIAGAELDRNLADSQARALAQLNAQNYSQALGASQTAFENQQRRQQQQSQLYGGIAGLYGNLGGQQANIASQQAGIGGQQAGIAGQQFGLGQLSQQTGLQDVSLLQQLGREQQAQQQAELDASRANQQSQLYEPYSRVAFLSDIYKGAPSTQTTLGSQVVPAAPIPSAFQQVAGVGTGLLGTAAAAKQIGGLF